MTPNLPEPDNVLVQVVSVDGNREISWSSSVSDQLSDRLDDIHRAIVAGAAAIADSIHDLPHPEHWKLGEVSASFGVTLTAEAGVILSKASAGATFEVQVTFRPDEE